MAQHKASDERTASARHLGGRSLSAPQVSPPPPLLLSLQQSAGNRAVAGLIQRLCEESGETRLPPAAPAPGQRLIQRVPWPNAKARFQTKNDEGAANSEYDVEKETYRRYAPINEQPGRNPDQVYQDGPRSFAYIEAGKEKDPDYVLSAKDTATATAAGNTITLKHGWPTEEAGKALIAHRVPQEGLVVWDADVEDNGTVKEVPVKGQFEKDVHVGHTVVNLGIDNDATLKAAAGREDLRRLRSLF